MPCTINTIEALRFHRDSTRQCLVNPASPHVSATELLPVMLVGAEMEAGAQCEPASRSLARGESNLRVLPNERDPASEASGTPLPDSKAEQPPVIRRAELVAFALVALLVIAVVTVLYFAKAFFLPIATAFVVGTMLSPAAGYLEKRHIPPSVSAVLILALACA